MLGSGEPVGGPVLHTRMRAKVNIRARITVVGDDISSYIVDCPLDAVYIRVSNTHACTDACLHKVTIVLALL